MLRKPFKDPLLLRLRFVLLVPSTPVVSISTGILVRDHLKRFQAMKTGIDSGVRPLSWHRTLPCQCLNQKRDG